MSSLLAANMVGGQDHAPPDPTMLSRLRRTDSDLINTDDLLSAIDLPTMPAEDLRSSLATPFPHASTASDVTGRRQTAVSNLLAQLSTSPKLTFTERPQPSISPLDSPSSAFMINTGLQNDTLQPADSQMEHSATMEYTNIDTNDDPLTALPSFPMFQSPPLGTGSDFIKEETEDHPQLSTVDQSGIEAFAKLEFADGNYFMTTNSCELGRDVRAYLAALARLDELENPKSRRADSSSGGASRRSERARKTAGSQVKGSVISEKAGFCGVDEDVATKQAHAPQAVADGPHSTYSGSSSVNPADLQLIPPPPPFDYLENARRQADFGKDDDEVPAPVTASHLPNPNSNPLIPIHAPTDSLEAEIKMHKGISRRHVKIAWDFKKEIFRLYVKGRNGAFVDGQFVHPQTAAPLYHGSIIQVSSVVIKFKLPKTKMASDTEDSVDAREGETSPMLEKSTTPTSNDAGNSASTTKSGKQRPSMSGKTGHKAELQQPVTTLGPDGEPLPPKKRGPGRPPKDGISSTRQKREEARRVKEAAAREANGGTTPPPAAKGKLVKLPVKAPEPVEQGKPEKRTYKKRKRAGDDVLPSIEGEESGNNSSTWRKPAKRTKRSKSPSPIYPPKDSLTEEQLAKPTDNYSRMLWDLLMSVYPGEMTLRNIYRGLKLKYPWFVYEATEGWTSSVRHNLNGEIDKLFRKGQKDGKGFYWMAIPDALPKREELEKKRQGQQAANDKSTTGYKQSRQPVFYGQKQGPPNWQNGQPGMPPPGNIPPQYWQHGPNGQVLPPNGSPWLPPAGQINPGLPYMNTPNGNFPPPQGFPNQANGHFAPSQSPNAVPSSAPNGAMDQGQPPSSGSQAPSAVTQTPQINGLPQPQSTMAAGPPPTPPVVAPPSAPGATFSAPNMPCTLEGLALIGAFERSMMTLTVNPEHTRQAFTSVRRRALHGAAESSMPDGEGREEKILLTHVQNFIAKHRNPGFRGFTSITGGGSLSRSATVPEASRAEQDESGTSEGEGGEAGVLTPEADSAMPDAEAKPANPDAGIESSQSSDRLNEQAD